MLITFTTKRVEAALDAIENYRAHLGEGAPPALAVMAERLTDLGRDIVGISPQQRDLLMRALLRHPKECKQPTGCSHDDHIGDLLLAITDPTGPGEYDSDAIAVVGTLYRLVIGTKQMVVECLSVEYDLDGEQLAHVRVWASGGSHSAPFPVQSLTVRAWFLAEVFSTP